MGKRFLPLVLLAAAGCGLSDYQARMDRQRERVQKFDDANRALDDPIDMPTMPQEKPKEPAKDAKEEPKEPEPAWLFDFYLRLPKGFGTAPKDKTPYYSPFPCFRYAGNEPGTDILIAAALKADHDPKAKDPEKFDKYYPNNFDYFVRMAIKDYFLKSAKADASWIDKAWPDKPDKRRPLAEPPFVVSPDSEVTDKQERVPYHFFELIEPAHPKAKDKKLSVFRVYVHDEPANIKDGVKEPGKQIAIVVHRPKQPDGPGDQFDKAMDFSLGTLDIGDAMKKRQDYRKAKR